MSDQSKMPVTEREVVWCWRSSHMVERCPACDGTLMGPMCCFTWSEWRCFGCGAHLDSRVVTPKSVHEPDDEPCIGPTYSGEGQTDA